MSRTLCPNPNDAGFKKLEQKYGYAEAFRIWETNNYEIPQHILDSLDSTTTLNGDNEFIPVFNSTVKESTPIINELSKKEQILKKSKSIIEKKLKKLSYQAAKNEKLEEGVRQLEELLKQLSTFETDIALVKFIKTASSMTSRAEKWMEKAKADPNSVTLESIQGIYDYVASFDILQELTEDMFEDEKYKKEIPVIQELVGRRATIKAEYLKIAKTFLTKQLAPSFGKVEAEYRYRAEKEFNKKRRVELLKQGKSKQEIQEDKEDFIQSYMEYYATEIEDNTQLYVSGMLDRTIDLSWGMANLVNPKDMNHDIINEIVRILDAHDYETDTKTYEATDKAYELFDKFKESYGKHADPSKQFEIFYDPDTIGTDTPVIINPESKGWDAFQKAYKGTPVMELYDFMVDIINEKDSYTGKQRLGYQAPRINKSTIERLASQGLIPSFVEGIKDQYKLRAEDTEEGSIEEKLASNEKSKFVHAITNESGKEREFVPLHYRAPVSEKDMSYDLLSVLLLDYHNSLNFNAKNKARVAIEAIKEVMADADVIQRAGFRQLYKKDQTGELVSIKGGEGTRLLNTIDQIIRHRVYGIRTEGDPQLAKIAGKFQSYTSLLGLAVNTMSGTANILQGLSMARIEAIGKNTGFYDHRDRNKAAVDYAKNMAGLIDDMGKAVPTNVINLLMRKYQADASFNPVENRFVENNRVKRLAKTGTLLFINSMGEHATQAQTMLSILNSTKVLDENGDFLDENFKPTKNKAEAVSLRDAYSVVDGKLTLNPAVKNTTRGSDFALTELIQRVNRDLYGNYDSRNKSAVQRTLIGNAAFQMRGWLVPGFQRRWRGIGLSGKKSEELSIEDRSYNIATGQFEEGLYTTTWRFLYTAKDELKQLKFGVLSDNWNELTDYEKGNIKKTIAELGLAVAAFCLYLAFSGSEGEDGEDLYLAYFSRRLYSELFTFTNPLEAVRTFRNPLMVVNTINDGLKLLIQMTDPTERYTTGKRKGELKLKRALVKMVPIWKQYDRDIEDALLFLERS